MDIENFKVGELDCYRDWDNEGAIYMRNAKTIERYNEIKDAQFDFEKHGIFFAFGREQFDQNYARMIKAGNLKESDKLYAGYAGGYGKKEGWDAFNHFADDKNEQIAKECDPQEVYFYEWNNHECMFGGDEGLVFALICGIFGNERAKRVKRF